MYKFKEGKMKVPCYIWSQEGSIEQSAIDQIKNAASLPFAFHHTALMPDGHCGFGAPIGGVLATKDVIVPSFVGVDIGCGMCAVRTSLHDIDKSTLKTILGRIREVIPVGFNSHKEAQDEELMPHWAGGEYPIIHCAQYKAKTQLGTLGGGNHFIEIQKGDDDYIWIMIHSGSRNLGKQVADHYNKIAKDLNKKWKASVPPSWDLAFLPTDSAEGRAYIREMEYCVEFALANRKLMMERVKSIFTHSFWSNTSGNIAAEFPEPMINIAHNYAALENHYGQNVWVHRKGATLARKGVIGIIPGSQGTKSYIVEGKGNKESFDSCSHGAGRLMSRSQARKNLNLEEEVKKLDDQGILHGIRGTKDLDEASSAYKDIDTVMENQKDLVDIKVELTPLAVVKG